MPQAANHWNPKPQERDRLLAELSPSGFRLGSIKMKQYSLCLPIRHVLHELSSHISFRLDFNRMIDWF